MLLKLQPSGCKLEGNSAKDLADNLLTSTIIDGVTLESDNYNNYDRIYLGQAVTFQCKTPPDANVK